MNLTRTALDGVVILTPRKFEDSRGFLSESYNKRTLAGLGIEVDFVQDIHSRSVHAGTVRGLHFQTPPFAQTKLVRVVRGRILDVAVDLRRNSPTFKQHVAVELSADAWNQLLIPAGFAHGLLTLEPETEVNYKVSDFYSPEHDRGILWTDPDINIPWPIDPAQATLSPKDTVLPSLAQAWDHLF